MSGFQGKVIAITGGASGLGLATAKVLATKGAKLSLADVQENALKAAATELTSLGADVFTYQLDVRSSDQVDAWIVATVEKYGKLDGAANMAGVTGRNIGLHDVSELENDDWDFVIGVNLTGLMYCMRAQLRNISNGGSIVNAASVAGVMGRAKNASYTASKHGVVGLTRSAAKEFGKNAVRVNCIAPGTIDTPMVASARQIAGKDNKGVTQDGNYSHIALNRVGQPNEVANLVVFLLSDDSTFITGATYSVDGGWNC